VSAPARRDLKDPPQLAQRLVWGWFMPYV